MSQYQSIIPSSDTFIPTLPKLPAESLPVIASDIHRKLHLLRWQQGLVVDYFSGGEITNASFVQEVLKQISKDIVSAANILHTVRKNSLPEFQIPEIATGVDVYQIHLTSHDPILFGLTSEEIHTELGIPEKELLLSILYGCRFRFVGSEGKQDKFGYSFMEYTFEGVPLFSEPHSFYGSADVIRHLKGHRFQVGHPERIRRSRTSGV